MNQTALKNYCPAPAAQPLAKQLFDLPAHVGRFLVANFHRRVRNCGYLYSFMRWRLIDQATEELEALSLAVARSLVVSRWTYLECDEYMISSGLRRVSWRQCVV